jgi:hypothetical protein
MEEFKRLRHLRREISGLENTIAEAARLGGTETIAELVKLLAAEKEKLAERIAAAEKLIERLEKSEHRQVLREHYILNKKIRVIAKESFYSESSIKKFLKSASETLKKRR